MGSRPRAAFAQGERGNLVPRAPSCFSPNSGPPLSTTVAPPRSPPPAAVAKLPRATSARAAAGNQLPVQPSPFSPTPRAPTSSQAAGPGPSPACRPPPLFCGEREGRRKGNFAQKPLPFSLFLKEPSHSLTFLQNKPSLLLYFKNKPFHHISLILNKPLPFSKITQTFPRTLIRSFH